WFAGTSSLISVGVCATMFLLGLRLRQLLVATLFGVALSFLPLGRGTLAGKWCGQPTMVVSRATFGLRGNALPTVLA
ncbi:cytosine permease, partial [Campylobacter jejuni]|nr:cytosine permease [Campylobacter jejuni]